MKLCVTPFVYLQEQFCIRTFKESPHIDWKDHQTSYWSGSKTRTQSYIFGDRKNCKNLSSFLPCPLLSALTSQFTTTELSWWQLFIGPHCKSDWYNHAKTYFHSFQFSQDHSTDLVCNIILWIIDTTGSSENCGNLSGFTAEQKHTVELYLKLLK